VIPGDAESIARFERSGKDHREWLRDAKDLHRAAGALWQRRPSARDDPAEFADWVFSEHKVAMMLEGLALETLAKAALVRVDPDRYIRKGTWWRKTHDLLKLAGEAGLPSGDVEEMLVLLTTFIEWAGKYPIPLDHTEFPKNWLSLKNTDQAVIERTSRDGSP
jgi:hypothetical protein